MKILETVGVMQILIIHLVQNLALISSLVSWRSKFTSYRPKESVNNPIDPINNTETRSLSDWDRPEKSARTLYYPGQQQNLCHRALQTHPGFV